ncbi:MAG: S8/S53 family peptidase [Bacteroidia bacterium]|nr:S8/S53 family peptidase [Bacteroidia bacterium]
MDRSLIHSLLLSQPKLSWALRHLKLDRLHTQGLSGKGIRIGHLDSGIHTNARDLHQKVDLSCVFDWEGNPDKNLCLTDDTGHGTRTASLVVGSSRSRTFIGAAPDASLVSAKVLEGGQIVLRILKGLDWMAAQKVPVILLCAGLPTPNPVFGPMMERLRKQGVLVICPIGNTGNNHFLQPGDHASVLSVGAHDEQGLVPKFSGSRHGRFSTNVLAPDILAPGVHIPCAQPIGGIGNFSGTSMAAALVAGVAALLLQAVPEAHADLLYDAFCYSSQYACETNRKHVRCGLLDAEAALVYLQVHKKLSPQKRPTRPSTKPIGWKDPRLMHQLTHTDNKESLTAIYIFHPNLTDKVWEARMRQEMQFLLRESDSFSTDYLSRAKALVLTGTPALHQKVLLHPALSYASAADAGSFLQVKPKLYST